MLEVHLDPATINSRKVLAGLELLGVPYTINHVNYFAGAHKQPPYTDLNPNGVLPTAKDGDFTLWESDAILQYAADMSASDKYYPKDLKKRVDINRWLLWEAAHWQPSCYVFFIENAIKPLLKAPTDQAALEKETPNWRRLVEQLPCWQKTQGPVDAATTPH
jgi:glutathione S-transferase